MLGARGAGGGRAAMVELARGVGVAVPESLVRGSVEGWSSGAGSMTFVRLGRGELGSDGGSWPGAGVLASFGILSVVDLEVEAVRMGFWWGACRRVVGARVDWLDGDGV